MEKSGKIHLLFKLNDIIFISERYKLISSKLHCLYTLFFSIYFKLTQRMRTRVIRKDINPEWNEDLTLSVTDPSEPVILVSLISFCYKR